MGLSTSAYIALAAAGASAAGNYIQQRQNNDNVNKQYNAQNAALLSGVQKQDVNAANANQVLNKTIDKFQPAQQAAGLGDMVANRTNAINANVNTPGAIDTSGGSKTAPTIVGNDLATKMAGASAYAKQQGGALGAIGGIGDQLLGNSMALNTSGNQIGQISKFAQGDAGVTQAQIAAAGHNARSAPNGVGSILSQAGNAGMMYGASGAAANGWLAPAQSVTDGVGAVTTGLGGLY